MVPFLQESNETLERARETQTSRVRLGGKGDGGAPIPTATTQGKVTKQRQKVVDNLAWIVEALIPAPQSKVRWHQQRLQY